MGHADGVSIKTLHFDVVQRRIRPLYLNLIFVLFLIK